MLQHLRTTAVAAKREWVITSTNPLRVREIAHAEEPVYEIIGKPYDLQVIVDAVKDALNRSPVMPGEGEIATRPATRSAPAS